MGSNRGGITNFYLGLYLHPWALRGESYTVFSFSAREQRQEVKQQLCPDANMSPTLSTQDHYTSSQENFGLHLSLSCVFSSLAKRMHY